MPSYFAHSALLPSGWSDAVSFSIDGQGFFTNVRPNSDPVGTEILPGVAVPGAVNLHSHAFQRGMAGLAERGGEKAGTFWSWRDVMYEFVSSLTPTDVQTIAAQLYVEMLRAGYTSVVEFHYLHMDPVGRPYATLGAMSDAVLWAAAAAGIGITHVPTLYRSGGFDAPVTDTQRRFVMDPDMLLLLLEGLVAESAGDPQRRVGLGLHSLRAVPHEELGSMVTAAWSADSEAPIHIHVAEQRREVEECVAALGARPVEWLVDNSPLDSRWCTIHATHLSPDEIRKLASSGAVAGLCPTTEANLGDGIFPLPDFLGAGGTIGIGSDSHVTVDPVGELRLLEYGQRLLWESRNVAARGRDQSTGAFLYQATLKGGARAAGRPVGALAEGHRADIVILDPDHPTLAGRTGDTLLDSWVFSATGSPVTDVMVGGRWVVRDGHHASEEPIAARYRTAMERLWA
ncbi:MAG: formimidoylglutamate deiminase [Gemmatimonadetes bacterium]|nr:formimidoylglutamate deiminase [Gemmatimonadota bacterium]